AEWSQRITDMRTRSLLTICVALLVAGFAFWPTVWRYSALGSGTGALPVRTNRITGVVELMIPGRGWVRQGAEHEKPAGLEVLPDSDRARITGTASFKYDNSFDASLYNGSQWEVFEVEYRIAPRLSKN